jgi:nucleoside diphosphate kinase
MSAQRTLAIVKPDAVAKRVAGKIITRIEEAGFTILAARLVHMSLAEARGFYYVHRARPFYESLCSFMAQGPCLLMVLEGDNAIQRWRDSWAPPIHKAAAGTIRRISPVHRGQRRARPDSPRRRRSRFRTSSPASSSARGNQAMRIAKVLVANRGEIAVRVIRACREQGIASVAVFSEADREALHVLMADEAYPIGPPAPSESYLAIDKIVRVAKAAGADAVHPGYGFLAENAAFAEACGAAGLSSSARRPRRIRARGQDGRTAHRARARGADGARDVEPVAGEAAVLAAARQIGYPLMIKASMGGGGRDARRPRRGELVAALGLAQSEAAYSFGDGAVYLERRSWAAASRYRCSPIRTATSCTWASAVPIQAP